MMKILWRFYYLLPPKTRIVLKNFLKGNSGHKKSIFNVQIAMRDARGKCRLDHALEIFIKNLRNAQILSINGKNCLEIGTGYVGINSVIAWILGAESVVSIDLNRILVISALKESIRLANRSTVNNLTLDYCGNIDEIKNRLKKLYQWVDSDNENTDNFFDYQAPHNILNIKENINSDYDLIFSVSTLEHIDLVIIDRFIDKLSLMTKHGGINMHYIDLSDHFDHRKNPLKFLGINSEYNENMDSDSRGNRLRINQWLEIFSRKSSNIFIAEEVSANKKYLPLILEEKFKSQKIKDLLVISILVRIDY
ncbi:MAG: hypothetical protein ACOYB0_07070 [Polynucleobacter sp.]